MLETLRRVVTGHNAVGRSVIEIDGPPASTMKRGGGAGTGEIWITPAVPADNGQALADLAAGAVSLEPPKGGVKLRWFAVAPENPDLAPEELEALAAASFAAIKASHARVDTRRHPTMHVTETVDYVVLLRGTVTLVLDEDETELRPGDVVVQRGTNHAWVNRGSEPALLLAVLIDAGP